MVHMCRRFWECRAITRWGSSRMSWAGYLVSPRTKLRVSRVDSLSEGDRWRAAPPSESPRGKQVLNGTSNRKVLGHGGPAVRSHVGFRCFRDQRVAGCSPVFVRASMNGVVSRACPRPRFSVMPRDTVLGSERTSGSAGGVS